MPDYRIHLANLRNALNDTERADVGGKLTSWFQQIVTSSPYTGASVIWTPGEVAVAPHELLIYFVPSELDGVLAAMPGYVAAGEPETGGLTFMASLTGSEVYASLCRPGRCFAEVAFHEAMHNKLRMGNELHRQDGLAVRQVSSGFRPSMDNIARMRAALPTARPQWTGGWTTLDDPLTLMLEH